MLHNSSSPYPLRAGLNTSCFTIQKTQYAPYERKQMISPSTSWPGEPGSKKMGRPMRLILRTHSKISKP